MGKGESTWGSTGIWGTVFEMEIKVNTMLFTGRNVNSQAWKKLVSCDLGFVLYVAEMASEGHTGLAHGRCLETGQYNESPSMG